jgi:hypothetical protein
MKKIALVILLTLVSGSAMASRIVVQTNTFSGTPSY